MTLIADLQSYFAKVLNEARVKGAITMDISNFFSPILKFIITIQTNTCHSLTIININTTFATIKGR